MRLMQEDAMDKVKRGITTLDEVMRVVPFEHEAAVRCRNCGKGLASTFLFCPFCCSKITCINSQFVSCTCANFSFNCRANHKRTNANSKFT